MGSAQLCLMLARDVVDRELERLLGRELTRPLEFAVSMDLTGTAAAGWLAALDVLEREATRPDGITRFRLAAAYLENLIIDGLLLAQPHNYRDALALAASAPRSRGRGSGDRHHQLGRRQVGVRPSRSVRRRVPTSVRGVPVRNGSRRHGGAG